MKILITSDNHLGFKETDPIRKDDTFRTFEEILTIAKQEKVDFVIQGGDLFDENKPSRHTYNKTIQILKKFCLGREKSLIRSNFLHNYDDIHMSISLPIFGIHGNHDDPSGFNTISPMDIISSSGLINYFGKYLNMDEIIVEPILLEKDVKVALYGIGYIKDRIIYKMFKQGKIKFNRPDDGEWYNILVIHQNRTPRDEEYIPEDFIEPFFDLVIYGHEHESIKLKGKYFDIIQCGSTVRTSLCEGECSSKYVYIVDIAEKLLIQRILLKTVRPLIMDMLKIKEGIIDQLIISKIKEMIDKAKYENEQNSILPENQHLPLLRLRIDLDSEKTVNKHDIFEFLVGNVANPIDVLKICKKNIKTSLKQKENTKRLEITDVFSANLSRLPLKTIIPFRMVDSLKDFLNKDKKDAFESLIKDSVINIINRINFDALISENLETEIRSVYETLCKEQRDVQINMLHNEVFSEINLEDKSSKFKDENSYKISKLDDVNNNSFASNYVLSEDFDSKTLENRSFQATLENSSNIFNSGVKESLINTSKEFTFAEDKFSFEENRQIIGNLKLEQMNNVKKQKKSSSNDAFTFTDYL